MSSSVPVNSDSRKLFDSSSLAPPGDKLLHTTLLVKAELAASAFPGLPNTHHQFCAQEEEEIPPTPI